MSDRFKNKYRIEPARLKNWDYGSNASYFVTICTVDRICFFGNVADDEMILNDLGLIARDCWLQIPDHFSFVKLGGYVVMPNHVHGIVIIDEPVDEPDGIRNDLRNVETRLIASLPNPNNNNQPGGITGNKNPMLQNNLSKIIRWYKGQTTFESRKINEDFAWQPRFHDHIIRNKKSFYQISEYIINNPLKWSEDQFR